MSDRLIVLTYHRVHRSWDVYNRGDVDLAAFDWQMRCLRRYFNVIRLDEAVTRLSAGARLPRRAVCITFDDGYRDNFTTALPVLNKYGLPATFFIATAFLNGGIMWNDRIIEAVRVTKARILDLTDLGFGAFRLEREQDRVSALATLIDRLKYEDPAKRDRESLHIVDRANVLLRDDLMMLDSHVKELSEYGMEIGAHTHTHPIVRRLSASDLVSEIGRNRAALESITRKEVRGFAYPNGRKDVDFTTRERDAVASTGMHYAMTTDWGCIRAETDRFSLPRITPWDKTPFRWCARVLASYFR